MKKTLFAFFVLGLCVISIAFIFGCGANPTSGGGSSSSGASNKGTITGYAYVCDYKGGTYTGTPDVTISISTEAMSLEAITTTNADGKYTLSGLPSGLITITATGDGYDSQTIVADSSAINFVIKELNIGTATIRGTIEGVAGGTDVYLKGYSGPFNNVVVSTIFFDPTTLTYEATGAAAGDIYIRAFYTTTDGGLHYHYAYNHITTSSGGTFYMNISFEAGVTIDATTISVPSGYTASKIRAYVSKNNQHISCVSDEQDISGTSCKLEDVAPLKAGDSYIIRIDATNEANDLYRKYYLGRSAGSQTFIDNSSLPSQFMVNPASGKFTTTPTTLEWNSVNGTNYYFLQFFNESHQWEWSIHTTETKITIPPCIARIIPTGETIIGIEARHYALDPQIYNLNAISPDNYWDFEMDNDIYANW